MNAMFDTVVRHDAAFDVLEFRIGRTNDEPSFVSMRVTSKTPDALTEVLEELLGFLYAECCTRNKAVEPKNIATLRQ